jgi:hypothetical protein
LYTGLTVFNITIQIIEVLKALCITRGEGG